MALAHDHDGAAHGRYRAAVVAPDARPDMKALIIDTAVHSLGGHHFNAVQRLQGELAGLGVAAPCLGSAYADRRVVEELTCTPTFTRSVYGRTYAAPGEFADSVEETGRQLADAMRRSGMPDLIILPCCDQVSAMALARLLKRSWSRPRPRILLWLLYGPHHLTTPDDNASAELDGEARAAFAELAANAGGIGAYCETPAMADFYRGLVPFEVGVMHGPGLPARARAIRAAGGPPLVSCIGFANRAKGYRLLAQAMRHVLDRHRDVRFMIHGIVKGSDAEADQPMFDRLAALGERVEVRQEVLTSDEYLARLAETDLLLLPYDPDVYRRRGSGVFADAYHVGIPVVAPKDCAFARPAFDDGWGVAMTEYDGKSLGIAVLEALDRLAPLSACAAQAAGQVRDDLSRVLGASVEGLAGRPAGLAGLLRRFRPGNAPRSA
jgi:glycosyltransferase involved in cell wall biosynthesis